MVQATCATPCLRRRVLVRFTAPLLNFSCTLSSGTLNWTLNDRDAVLDAGFLWGIGTLVDDDAVDFGLTVVVDVVAIMPLSLGAADRDLDRAGDLPLPSALNAATLPIVLDGIAIFGVFDRALAADGLRALMTVVEVKPAVLCDDDALDGALDVALGFFSGFMLATDSSRFSAVSGVSSLSLPMLYLSGSPTCNALGSTVVAPPSP